MTSIDHLLSEEKSAAIAEVSVDTIRQFQRFGLIEGKEKDGHFFFQEEDIFKVFCLDKSRLSAPPQGDDRTQRHDNLGDSKSDVERDQKRDTQGTPPTVEDSRPKITSETISAQNAETIAPANILTQEEHHRPAHQPQTDLYELMEKNQGLKEQIQVLKEERDWLRTRLEKFEIRAEREQMLFLSSTETVRTLALQPQKRRIGFLPFSLPWFKNTAEVDKK